MTDELRAAAEECRELHREITGRLYERSEQNLREMPLVMVPASLVKRLEMALPTLTEHILTSQPDDVTKVGYKSNSSTEYAGDILPVDELRAAAERRRAFLNGECPYRGDSEGNGYVYALGEELRDMRILANAQCAYLDEHPADDAEPVKCDMRKVVEALGFDPTNHHNAGKCPYCNPFGF